MAGILIVDYYLLRGTRLEVGELYREGGQYSYRRGWNPVALLALILGVLPNVPGFLNAAFPQTFPGVSEFFRETYTYAWFVGLAIASVVYGVGMACTVAPRDAAWSRN